ncbi:lysophospholipid acyltransferase family protein [Lentisphaerota bacterium WC36G]|nr:lysophospholipid acyltransferase family protein [Lentisphaerae bacterium WC36]
MQAQLQQQNASLKLENNNNVISNKIGRVVASQISFPLPKVTGPLLKKVSGLRKLDPLYNEIFGTNQPFNHNFLAQKILDTMNINLEISVEQLDHIPKDGPLIVVSNHPYGGLDGIALLAILKRVRPDVKLMANYLLGEIPNLENDLISVDPFEHKNSLKNNLNGMREAKNWVKNGHVLGIFPAGEVSSYKRQERRIADKKWATNIGSLVKKSNCSVICINFDGHNRMMFQLMGLIHPSLRTLILPREFMHVANHSLKVNISSEIKDKKIAKLNNSQEIIDYLRMRCEILAENMVAKKRQNYSLKLLKYFKEHAKKHEKIEEICAPINSVLIADEFAKLPAQKVMKSSGDYTVYCVDSTDIPNALQELGRLRETTFRIVGEGTNKACDLDWRDHHYKHLILWNNAEKEIVGAYRMGLIDKLVEEFGFSGVYTSTLFKFSKNMKKELHNAIELGRSFIQQKYQKNPIALGLLWKGVMAFVAQNPQYCKLFGPVSISNDYQDLSKFMIMDYLKNNHYNSELASQIKAKHQPKIKVKNFNCAGKTFLSSINDIDELIADIDPKCPHAPVLIRQYIRLNGKFLSFNIDPDFNDSIDALILTDLREKSATTSRYMGKEKYQKFLAKHS